MKTFQKQQTASTGEKERELAARLEENEPRLLHISERCPHRGKKESEPEPGLYAIGHPLGAPKKMVRQMVSCFRTGSHEQGAKA